MYQVNEDNSIYVTRGDIVNLAVTAKDNGETYLFQPGDVSRIKVFVKKDCTGVVLQKDFPVTKVTDTVEIFLDENDTKIGETISKPVDYWYEVELINDKGIQTIIGYDEDGTKVFRLFPEGRDLTENDPIIQPEDIPIVDEELSLNSKRPVENQVVTRALYRLEGTIKRTLYGVTPQVYGAIADGVADDTEAIRAAITVGDVYFPKGIYLVSTNTARRISVPSNRHIRFEKGAILKGINDNASVSSVLLLKDVDNVTIEGATIIGDIEENTNTAEGAGHGIQIQGSSNITIRDCIIKNCFTDGIYTIGVDGVKIFNTEFDNCGRLSCGTTCGKNVLIEGCSARNNKRVLPMSGFFVEPNFSTDYIQNVVIRNCVTENMGGAGYYATLGAINSGEDITLSFENCVDYGSTTALMVGDFKPSVKHGGFVKITNFASIKSGAAPISIRAYGSNNTPTIYFDGVTLVDGNKTSQPATYGSAIVFESTTGTDIGNVDINNIRTVNGGNVYRGIYTTIDLSNVNVSNHDFVYKHSEHCINYRCGIAGEKTFYEATSANIYYDVVKINGCGVDFYEPKRLGKEIEIYLSGAQSSFRIRKHNIDGLTTSVGQSVIMTSKTGYLKLKKISDDLFIVLAKHGTFKN